MAETEAAVVETTEAPATTQAESLLTIARHEAEAFE